MLPIRKLACLVLTKDAVNTSIVLPKQDKHLLFIWMAIAEMPSAVTIDPTKLSYTHVGWAASHQDGGAGHEALPHSERADLRD